MPRAKTGKYEVLGFGDDIETHALVRIPPGGSADELRRLLAAGDKLKEVYDRVGKQGADVIRRRPAKPRKATRKTKGRK